MNYIHNPIPQAAKFLRSLRYQPRITDTSLEFEGTTIAAAPGTSAPACTQVTVLMRTPSDPAGASGAFLVIFVINSVMGPKFDAASFFEKAGQELLRGDCYREQQGGISITVMPDAGRWRVQMQPG
jgi:hypothetical protein